MAKNASYLFDFFCKISAHPLGTPLKESAHVFQQADIFPGHWFHTNAHFSPVCHPLLGKLQSKMFYMSRSIPMHGICSYYIPIDLERHRGQFASPESQGLLHGYSGNASRATLAYANEERDWRINAYLAISLIGIARKLYQREKFSLRPGRDGGSFSVGKFGMETLIYQITGIFCIRTPTRISPLSTPTEDFISFRRPATSSRSAWTTFHSLTAQTGWRPRLSISTSMCKVAL